MRNATIRLTKDSDLVEIAELISRSIRTLNAADDSPEDIAWVCATLNVNHLRRHLITREVFVLEVDGKIKGTSSLKVDRLHTLFVEPRCVRMGYGRKLVNHIEILAHNNHVSVLKVSAARTSVAFYERLGFKKLEFEQREFASTWAMEKRL